MSYYIIIGGTKKSGTTSLFASLSSIPSITPSYIKQTFYFLSKEERKKIKVASKNYKNYTDFFDSKSDNYLEATAEYMYSSFALKKIKLHFEKNQGKFILILRNPVNRFISYYNYLIQQGLLSKTTMYEYYHKCLNCKDPLDEIYGIFESGLYSKYIPNVINTLGEENVFITYLESIDIDFLSLLDELKRNGIEIKSSKKPTFSRLHESKSINSGLLSKLYRFLRKLIIGYTSREVILITKMIFSPLYKKINLRKESNTNLNKEFRQLLEEAYKSELHKYTNREYGK